MSWITKEKLKDADQIYRKWFGVGMDLTGDQEIALLSAKNWRAFEDAKLTELTGPQRNAIEVALLED